MLKKIQQSIDNLYSEMVEIRRYLHQYPEVSFQEFKTAQYIADFYEKLNIPYERNVGGNGVIATLKGGKPGKTVALRADFDALAIQDEKDVPYKSKNPGAMHACGHDGHTATLLVLAKVMKEYQEDLVGTILFLHQHAEEETPGGAKPIVESGALDHVDAVFGNHLWATTPLGTIQTRNGVFMAGTDRFEITIKGQGGHGAYPHETKDAVVIGAEVVSQLQNIVSRRVDPLKTAVITVGKFAAGNTFNIIADQATLIGTVRYLDTEIQSIVREELERVVKGICLANNAGYELNYGVGYPPVMNHEEETKLVFEASQQVSEVQSAVEVAPQMGGEDFAHYLNHKPGAFFFTGAKIEGQNYPHHHPKFDINEKSMPIAAKMLIGAYFAYQEKNK
ncbi:M20 family metallopeptidase [Pseudogracilibacillus auburnensis]|uniref:Amidohydrolase n=1 Tax=Pseudogracilibacillus auburnensis TaxID=1494959 RepID=A0A2V3VZP7_9BACI|nr:M20 family metallopeptidase [Pseudogracilibacillus auburnensis]PXW87036.1 amidohydrolase [Pseudogracilibacillus auburnensis]